MFETTHVPKDFRKKEGETDHQHYKRSVRKLAKELYNSDLATIETRLNYLTSIDSDYALGKDYRQLYTDVAWAMREV